MKAILALAFLGLIGVVGGKGPLYTRGILNVRVYAEFAGEDRQIEKIKAFARQKRFVVTCEERVGKLDTLRLMIPAGTDRSVVEGHFGLAPSDGQPKEQLIYPGMRLRHECILLP